MYSDSSLATSMFSLNLSWIFEVNEVDFYGLLVSLGRFVFFTKFEWWANSVGRSWWVMLFFWKNRNYEISINMFKILIDIRTLIFNWPLLLKGPYKYFLKIRELFWYLKMENGQFGGNKNKRNIKWAHILYKSCG